jgi:hypothetical protein
MPSFLQDFAGFDHKIARMSDAEDRNFVPFPYFTAGSNDDSPQKVVSSRLTSPVHADSGSRNGPLFSSWAVNIRLRSSTSFMGAEMVRPGIALK